MTPPPPWKRSPSSTASLPIYCAPLAVPHGRRWRAAVAVLPDGSAVAAHDTGYTTLHVNPAEAFAALAHEIKES